MLSVPIYVLFYVTATDDDDDELGLFTQLAFGIFATVLFCRAKFFTFVFYCECKQSEGGRVDTELGVWYGLVPRDLQVGF